MRWRFEPSRPTRSLAAAVEEWGRARSCSRGPNLSFRHTQVSASPHNRTSDALTRPRTHKWARFPLRSESDRIAAAQRNNARCHEPTPRPGEVIKQELGSDVLHKQ